MVTGTGMVQGTHTDLRIPCTWRPTQPLSCRPSDIRAIGLTGITIGLTGIVIGTARAYGRDGAFRSIR
ncbi:MAG: hypothetical protein RLZZ481_1468 [Pseudomonadota bacterium]